MKGLFSLIEDVTGTADLALATFEGRLDELARFDVALLTRGVNALKAGRLLLEQGHWEFAAAVVRQLFELVVNMEHIAAQPDRRVEVFKYAKYGLLQSVRHEREKMEYDRLTGRAVDAQRIATLDGMLANRFSEFRKGDRKEGSPRWATSWCDRTTRQLAEASPNALRAVQYRTLFTIWSEQVHGSPGALLDSMFRQAREGWLEKAVATDDARISEVASMAVVLFMELWGLLPNAPTLNPEDGLRWSTALIDQSKNHKEKPPPGSANGLA